LLAVVLLPPADEDDDADDELSPLDPQAASAKLPVKRSAVIRVLTQG
jgi:hypothetical protein